MKALISLLILLAVIVLVPVAWTEEPPVFLLHWDLSGMSMGGLQADASGDIYVTNHLDAILKFDGLGTFLTIFDDTTAGPMDGPRDVDVDAAGNIFVTEQFSHRIQKFDALGNFLTQWGLKDSAAAGEGEFSMPLGIATDMNGNVYVADTGNDRIQKFDNDGHFIREWGSSGSGNGQFDSPKGIDVDASGTVYVADRGNNRIQKFNSNGSYLSEWRFAGDVIGNMVSPMDVAVDVVGNVYVLDGGHVKIEKFDPDGNLLTAWGEFGFSNTNGEFSNLEGITVDNDENVYVSNGFFRIQKFGPPPVQIEPTTWGRVKAERR